MICRIGFQVTIEPTRSAENSHGKTARGSWSGPKSTQIAQAQCGASANQELEIGAPDVDLMQFMEMKAKLEAAAVKTDFPVAETPEELSKIQARRVAGRYRDDNDGLESGEHKNGLSPNEYPNEYPS